MTSPRPKCSAGHKLKKSYFSCRRRVVWRVGEQYFCAPHFDLYLEEHWDALDEFEIERLSEEESDFDAALRENRESKEPICQVPKPRKSEEGERERVRA